MHVRRGTLRGFLGAGNLRDENCQHLHPSRLHCRLGSGGAHKARGGTEFTVLLDFVDTVVREKRRMEGWKDGKMERWKKEIKKEGLESF